MDTKPTQHYREIAHHHNVISKLAFHKLASLSPTLFNIYIVDIPSLSAPVQVMGYADDIIVTSAHTSTSGAKKYIQPYLHKVFAWIKQNNLTLNPDKTTCTLFTPDPAEYTSNLDANNKQQCTTHGNAPKGSGSYLRPQNSHTAHTSTTSQYKHTNLYTS